MLLLLYFKGFNELTWEQQQQEMNQTRQITTTISPTYETTESKEYLDLYCDENNLEDKRNKRPCPGTEIYICGKQLCDGISDCPHNEDEQNCSDMRDITMGKLLILRYTNFELFMNRAYCVHICLILFIYIEK